MPKILVPVLSIVEKAAVEANREIGRAVLKESNRRAPRDDGTLVKSGRVTVDDLTVQVSYTAVHAPLQHERLEWRHAGGGEPKFLERAADAVDAEAIAAKSLRKSLGG